MDFCITYLDPQLPPSQDWIRPRYHIMTETGVLLFDSQAKAAKWILKFGMDHIEYSVDPYHDLEATFG